MKITLILAVPQIKTPACNKILTGALPEAMRDTTWTVNIVQTCGDKAKKITRELFLSHRITWPWQKMLSKQAFLADNSIKRSFLSNNQEKCGKNIIPWRNGTNSRSRWKLQFLSAHVQESGISQWAHLLFMNSYSSWQLESTRKKCKDK